VQNTMSTTSLKNLIFTQSLIATLWSLYYGRFWDPVLNRSIGEMRNPHNAFIPCQLCRFARILMYPIVILCIIWRRKKINQTWNIFVLSAFGILLESYQYRYQMTHSSEQIKSFICGISTGKSCAATDVMYAWFITIPFLCLVAFLVIFVCSILIIRRK
jgi:disulfide bond formation protein DsbB